MATTAPGPSEQATLTLLGWWELRVDLESLPLGRREQRLLALLALTGRRSRLELAGTLWPESTEHHATSNLRAAVWHIRHAAPGLITAQQSTLDLARHVRVDAADLAGLATRVTAAPETVDLADAIGLLDGGDLLPGWYDDWVLFHRERLEHLRLRALEALARASLRAGRTDDAVLAAAAALRIEPLHEGAVLLLVAACLAAGSPVEAVRHFHAYRRRLEHELGIRPSGALTELVAPLLVPVQREPVPAPQRVRR